MDASIQNNVIEQKNSGLHDYGNRKIIHVDMDAYYASIETLDHPEFKNLPLVVGGSPQSRGVVCTANYIARTYGIRSAMACSMAARLCPQAVFVYPRFKRYQEFTGIIRSVFQKYTDKIEPLSLDEAYLDVSHSPSGLYASQIAKLIQSEVYSTTGLTCSAGVAPNKLVAKIASDFRKPGGITVVTPGLVADFMKSLSVRKIPGVGPATEKRLNDIGIKTCSDIRAMDVELFKKTMGNLAPWLYRASFGLDFRSVEVVRERKSYGRETTFSKDLRDTDLIEKELEKLVEEAWVGMNKKSLVPKTITLKIRYDNFERITRSFSPVYPICDKKDVLSILKVLLREKTDAGKRPIRLAGLSMSRF